MEVLAYLLQIMCINIPVKSVNKLNCCLIDRLIDRVFLIDWLTCVVAGGGGADAGDVGEGGDVGHTDQCSGEVDPAAGHASASGHA